MSGPEQQVVIIGGGSAGLTAANESTKQGVRGKITGQYFLDYEVTFLWSFIGLAYGFQLGFFGGYLAASIYNGILGLLGSNHLTPRIPNEY